MSDNFLAQFIEDLVKGAEASEGFIRGSKPSIELSINRHGTETKLASDVAAEKYNEGCNAAKVAFLGALANIGGSIAGSHLAGKMFPKIMAKGGIGSQVLPMAGMMAGGMAANKVLPDNG